MNRPLAADLSPEQLPRALAAVCRATHRFLSAARVFPAAECALPGWDRLMVISHLAYGAAASLRMTEDCIRGRGTPFYPGGHVERERSLRRGAEVGEEILDELANLSSALHRCWSELGLGHFSRALREPRFPGAALSRLVVLRLTELEVHGGDLFGGPAWWSDEFIEIALPLRVAWLPVHHRRRADADMRVVGRWLLRVEGVDAQWVVSASPDGACVDEPAKSGQSIEATLSGPARDLLAFLVGRVGPDVLRIDGDRAHAARFKRAFPGP